jgi:queuine tRNA-ribosyltransferase
MPVGTKGTIKALTMEEILSRPELSCPIVLANTYHLAIQPGTELIRDHTNSSLFGGIHDFMGGWHNRAVLTDSGGFQMVSLLKLAEITEEGVCFENPFWKGDREAPTDLDETETSKEQNLMSHAHTSQRRLLLRPEDSITHQNNIGADIIMALDDVVSSMSQDPVRFKIATYRTLRWMDRCLSAHSRPTEQNLFAIVQGGLDTSLGGLREQCLAGFQLRDAHIPGYAIGGLAGGESKDDFWKVVDQCCKALPDDKPRYLMGVGYPLDLVICTALGVDMYDCVYPTRTARFGVALIHGESPGTLRLKSNECAWDNRVIMDGCPCQACAGGYSRSRLHFMLKTNNPLAISLMTNHNIAYMMSLVRDMRQAIMNNTFGDFVQTFIHDQFRGKEKGGKDIPTWVCDALHAAGIDLETR